MDSVTVNGQPVDSATLATITGIMSGIGAVISIAIFVLLIIAYWKMFTKAGEKGWKAIIPIYNEYVAFKLAWKDGAKNFWIYFIASIVMSALSGGFTTSATNGSLADANPVLALLAFAASIVMLVWYIRFLIKQAHAYNKGTGCGILAIFFPNIMTLFYGFAKTATYQGPQE